jgi:predicted HNH restriction endonuclease
MKIEVINNIVSAMSQYEIDTKGKSKLKSNNLNANISIYEFDIEKNKFKKSQIELFNEVYLEDGEFDKENIYLEGSQKYIIVNSYERDPKKRTDCIKKYGFTCYVCGMNFADIYGERGAGFIEVHHTIPLYKIKEHSSFHVDDLRPVCSNCHSMLHRYRDEITIEELRSIINKNCFVRQTWGDPESHPLGP